MVEISEKELEHRTQVRVLEADERGEPAHRGAGREEERDDADD